VVEKALCPATAVLIPTVYDDDQYIFALLEVGEDQLKLARRYAFSEDDDEF